MREVPEQCYSARLAWSLPIHSLDSLPWYVVGFIRRKDVFELGHWSLPIHSFERRAKGDQEGEIETKSGGSL